MTDVIKAQSDADFLAMVPLIAGFTATNSLVCAAFSGKQTAAAFRMDLPQRKRTADYRGVSLSIINALKRMPGVDGAAIVIYTDDTFAAERGVPWLEFSRHLGDTLHRQGFHLPGFFCIAADGWANYFDRDYPRHGRPLDEIVVDASIRPLEDRAVMPEVTDAARHGFLEELTSICTGDLPAEWEGLDDIAFVELCATWQAGPLPDYLAAGLTEICQSPAMRDVISLQYAFGDLVAESVAEDNLRYAQLQREQGGTMDEVVRREVDAGRGSIDDEFTGLLAGIGRVRPDVDRLERGIDQFKRIVALAPEHYLPNALCILAWMLWSRGCASAAGLFVDHALAIDPSHGMAQLLYAMIGSGRVPEWAYG